MGNCCGRKGAKREKAESAASNGISAQQPRQESVEEGEAEVIRDETSESVDGVPLPHLETSSNTPAVEKPRSRQTATSPVERDATVSVSTHVQYVPPKEWSTCAYCGNPTGDRYGYFFCSDMSPQLLDTLMDNGWWRTGRVLFKPCFPEVCCPGYTLRLPISEFQLKKNHRRIIKKWAQFLRHGDPRWEERHPVTTPTNHNLESSDEITLSRESELVRAAVAIVGVEKVEETEGESSVSRETTTEEERSDVSQSHNQQQRRKKRTPTPGRGPDPNRPPCRKTRVVREERRKKQLEAVGHDHPTTSPSRKSQPPSLHELLVDHHLASTPRPDFTHRLEVKLLRCNPRHPDLISTLPRAYELYDKFQESVHPGKTRFKSAEEFRWGFMTSPLINPPDHSNHLEGSYHMHYYLDGELIMISVLDILPQYFVSIYFIYDPDIRFLTPGIYTVLVELDLARKLQSQRGPRPHYYGLGYYNCNPKVSYKAQFKPQEVLCNETHVFVKLDSVAEKLSTMSYTRLASDEIPEKSGRTVPLDNVVVNISPHPHTLYPVRYLDLGQRLQNYLAGPLRQLVSETGFEAAENMVITTISSSSST